MGTEGQALSPQAEQTKISGQNEKPEISDQLTFPNMNEVNSQSYTTLVNYLQRKVECFKAGKLKDCYENWLKLTSDTEILDIVNGYKIEFSGKPCQLFVPQLQKNWSLEDFETCELEIAKLLQKKAIVPCQHEKDEFISPVFTTPKKDGTSRMILNLKGLNKFVQYCHFKMESFSTVVNMVKPNCYMASIDLNDAYYSVPIACADQKYLKFQWQGKLYKFTCFPNGLALCPRKFTKLLKPAYSQLRKLGHLSVSHIDESYLQGDDYADCANNVLATLRLFDLLGFTSHPDKSSLVPKQQITFLGFVIDSVAMKVYPTREKIDKLKRVCHSLLCCPQPIIREVASVLGFLISIFPAAQFGPLHFRDLDMDKTEALQANKGNFDKRMVLSNAAKADLQWWVDSAEDLCKPILSTKPEVTLYTDASKIGWGGVLDNIRIGGQWTLSEAANHINYLEMLAVLFALKAFAHTLVGKHVCVRIDNMTAVADIGKMGTSHSRKRNQLTQCIWHWCLENRVFITTAHIPGKENQLADAESRKCRKELEWALDTQVFNTGIQKLAILPKIDLFASRLNYKIICSLST